MAKLRSVSTAFWSDPFIEELTPTEKLLYIYFITNEKTNMLGIYEVSFKKICFETGINKETVLKAFETFQRLNKIKYEHGYIILINFMKHQKYNLNMKKSAIDTYFTLPKVLISKDIVLDKDNPSEAFETLSNGLGMVRKVEVEYKVENEDKSQGEESEPPKEKEHKLISYIKSTYPSVSKLTTLTNKEAEKIVTTFKPEIIIKVLSSMENKKDLLTKYKSCYLTLNNWLNKEKDSLLPNVKIEGAETPEQKRLREIAEREKAWKERGN